MTLAILDARDKEYVVVAAGADLIATYVQQAILAGQTAQEVLDAILAAGLSEGVFPSLAAGESGTAAGQYFWVGDAGMVVLYRNDAGVGTEIAELATAAGLATKVDAAALGGPEGADEVGYAYASLAPFIQTRKALEALRDLGASVRDTGAVGDGVADDSEALEEITAYFGATGGLWRLPRGQWRTTRKILIDCTKPQLILGSGVRKVYPGPYDVGDDLGVGVIIADHADNAFQFVSAATGDGNVTLRDLAVTTLNNGTTDDPADFPKAAFSWDTNDYFARNFRFEGCSIHAFETAFLTYKSGGVNIEVGLFAAENCTINRNLWIARTENATQWNGFNFIGNEAGQNGYLASQGGIDVQAHSANICRNSIEGTRDPIHIYGSMRGVVVEGNYLEAVVGGAAIHLEGVRGQYDIRGNSYLAIDYGALGQNVLLTNCGAGQVLGPYWPDGVYKTPPPVLGNSAGQGDNIVNPSGTDGFLRMDAVDGAGYLREPGYSAITKQRVATAGRELSPWNGRPMPVEEYISANPGAISLNYTLGGNSGEWVVLSWLFRRTPGAGSPADPYISMSVNGIGAAGSRDYIAYNFGENWRDGEWCLLTCAAKLGVTMTTLGVSLYPYGANPGPGRGVRYLRPVVYTVDDPNKIIPYIDDWTARSVTAAGVPNVPGFIPGDMLFNADVAAGNQAEFVKLAGADNNWVYT